MENFHTLKLIQEIWPGALRLSKNHTHLGRFFVKYITIVWYPLMLIKELFKTIPVTRKIGELVLYILFQLRLQKAEFDDLNFTHDSKGIAIPPARLRYRVHGNFDRNHFLLNGETIAKNLRTLVKISGHDWAMFSDILDFGCGPARVMRYFLEKDDTGKYFGTDIDTESIDWCKRNIPGVDWKLNQILPPTQYPDNAFDLVYAISVFTHINEELQNAWLSELSRITRPGAILILTIHGESVIQKTYLTKYQQQELENNGFLFVIGTKGKLKYDGLPDFYQTAYHKNAYIQKNWAKFFEIVAQVPKGINNHQDAVILRNRKFT